MKLTDTACKAAKTNKKAQKFADGGGMYLEVMPNGSKYWRMKYRYNGKEKRLALGVYPQVSLKEARDKRDRAKKQLEQGIDPGLERKKTKLIRETQLENTFEAIAREWHEQKSGVLAPAYAKTTLTRLERDIFPHIGSMPITDVTPAMILETLRKVEERGAHDIAKRLLQFCGQIFRYAVQTGRAEQDPSHLLRGALKPAKGKHYAALDIKELPAYLSALERNEARLYHQTRLAMKLIILTFVRTNELRMMRWEEISWDQNLWIIPAHRMKMRRDHLVPLSRQALELLEELKFHNGHREFVFPNQQNTHKPMSDGTLINAVKRLGYQGKMTVHGFRAMAMTAIKERLGYRHEIVDRQLAHARKNKIDAAYDRAEFLDERTKMMQDWADYLDKIASNGTVIQGNFEKRA